MEKSAAIPKPAMSKTASNLPRQDNDQRGFPHETGPIPNGGQPAA
jgi:hypothetical protein